jgi:hypothetical protein
LSAQFIAFNDNAAGTRTSHLTYTRYLAARAGRIASDLSPVDARAPRNVLRRGGAPSLSFEPFLKLCGTTVSFDNSTSVGTTSAGVEIGAIAEIASATLRGEIAIAGDIPIGGATVQNGVIADVEANATNEPTAGSENETNEPTAGPENVANEPTARPNNALNEPNSAELKQPIATNEPTARPNNAPNEPNSAELKQPIATNEPTAGPENVTNEPTVRRENAPNEPNSAAIDEPVTTNEPTAKRENASNEPNSAGIDEANVTTLNSTNCRVLLEVPDMPPLTSLENRC